LYRIGPGSQLLGIFVLYSEVNQAAPATWMAKRLLAMAKEKQDRTGSDNQP
jgi:hypothetical protein